MAEHLVRQCLGNYSTKAISSPALVKFLPEYIPSVTDYARESQLAITRWHFAPFFLLMHQNAPVMELETAIHVALERASMRDWKLRLAFLKSTVLSQNCVQIDCLKKALEVAAQHTKALFSHDLMKSLDESSKMLIVSGGGL
mgnify:CR=1 FL=1